MQVVLGQLHAAQLQMEQFKKMQAVCEQLQANNIALSKENQDRMDGEKKLQSIASQALSFAKTQQQEAASTVQRLKLKHTQELQV